VFQNTFIYDKAMLKDLLDKETVLLKILFDGYDFSKTPISHLLIDPREFFGIYKTTYISKLYDNVNDFISYCNYNEDGYLPNKLMQKYSCGLYNTLNANNTDNPWSNKDFILFNSKVLKIVQKVYSKAVNLDFWVCPAYNETNEIYAIGFRIKNPNLVKNAFKWLFTCGNNIIYGKNTVNKDKPCYVVEGYRDYIALNESGYNCIGLGSVIISKEQEEYINTLKEPILLLDNDEFGLKKTLEYKSKYRIATLMGTKEKDAWDAYCKGELHICQIQ
jgi:hypothetical protein